MRFDRLLAGTAVALVFAIGAVAQAASEGQGLAEPIPAIQPAEVTITPADVGAVPEIKPAEVVLDTPVELRLEASATGSITKEAPITPSAPAMIQERPEPAATSSIPAEPPAPPRVLTLAEQAGEKIKALLADKTNKQFDAKTRASLETWYAARPSGPVWSDNGVVNARAKAVAAQLAAAGAEGLDPADYPVPTLAASPSADAIAEHELALTDAALTYARHAALGRVLWSRVQSDIVYYQNAPEAADVMAKLASAPDAAVALDSYNPQHRAYKALKAKLAEVRGVKGDGVVARLAYGPILKVGMVDDRVPALRDRLEIKGEGTTYDKTLADAVKAFQKNRGLAANGTLTSGTIDALNPPKNDRTADVILANLERWRWVPHDLGKAHVIVNVPEYTLRLFKDDAVLWQTRVVVGKPSTATPILTETMKFITVNPTWNVPPSIVYGEYLPALRQDPTVLARMGLRVSTNANGGIHVSQPPGPANALGRIRFNFPNKFLVYQHDTPDKHLFAHDKRAYSHGCMRVQNPDQYAEALLSVALPKENYTAARIRNMYGSGEVNINFPEPIPVHLTYQTAFVDQAGKLVLRDDIYGRDTRTIAALKSAEERRIADATTERLRREVAAAPAASSRPARRQARVQPPPEPTGFSFFGLFR